MKEKIKIFITCLDEKIAIPDNELLELVGGGSANRTNHIHGMTRDDSGDNISKKNPRFNDAATIYWAWKNRDLDYYGFMQYRRMFEFVESEHTSTEYEKHYETNDVETFSKMMLDSPSHMRNIIEKYDVITCNPLQYDAKNYTLYQQYYEVPYSHEKDICKLVEIIQRIYPEYIPATRKVLFETGKGYFANIFIMKKEIFHSFCEWMFRILLEFDEWCDYSEYSLVERRAPGFLSERLLSIYYYYLEENSSYKFGELQKCFFDRSSLESPSPLTLTKTTIPIILFAERKTLPELSCVINSIEEFSSKSYMYEIVVIQHDLSSFLKEKILSKISKENIKIVFVNAKGFMRESIQDFHNHEVRARLMYRVMQNFSSYIYMESYILLQEDISISFMNSSEETVQIFNEKLETSSQNKIVLPDLIRVNTAEIIKLTTKGSRKITEENKFILGIAKVSNKGNNSAEGIQYLSFSQYRELLYLEWNLTSTQSLERNIKHSNNTKNVNVLKIKNYMEDSPFFNDVLAREVTKVFVNNWYSAMSKVEVALTPDMETLENTLDEVDKLIDDAPIKDCGAKPAFDGKSVPIMLMSSNEYLPFLSVTLQSIINTGNNTTNYDILIFHEGIPVERRERVIQMIELAKNFSIRFYNISEVTQLFTNKHMPQYVRLIFVRVMLPFLLPHYEHVICVDSDMIVQIDLAESLSFLDGKNMVVAAHEWCYSDYGKSIGLKNADSGSFNAGFAVYQLNLFREKYTQSQLIQLCNLKNWRYLDQDVLNIICEGSINFLSHEWNWRVDYESLGMFQIVETKNSENYFVGTPKIIHFAGQAKPWINSNIKFEEIFWDNAKSSPFYEQILLSRVPKPFVTNVAPNLLLPINHPIRKILDIFLPKGGDTREWVKSKVRKLRGEG